jgi:hypothetical protein
MWVGMGTSGWTCSLLIRARLLDMGLRVIRCNQVGNIGGAFLNLHHGMAKGLEVSLGLLAHKQILHNYYILVQSYGLATLVTT